MRLCVGRMQKSNSGDAYNFSQFAANFQCRWAQPKAIPSGSCNAKSCIIYLFIYFCLFFFLEKKKKKKNEILPYLFKNLFIEIGFPQSDVQNNGIDWFIVFSDSHAFIFRLGKFVFQVKPRTLSSDQFFLCVGVKKKTGPNPASDCRT